MAAILLLDLPGRHPWPVVLGVLAAWLLASYFHSCGKIWHTYREFPEKYGPLVRIGSNTIITDDPVIIRKLGAPRETHKRGSWYKGARLNPYNDHMLSILETKTHDERKAKSAGAYSGRETPWLEASVDEQYLPSTESAKRLHLPLDFAQLSAYFTMDVISKLAFGEQFGCLRTDSDYTGFITSVRSTLPRIGMLTDHPWLRAIFFSRLFLKYFGPKISDPTGVGKMMGVAHELVVKRFEPGAKDEKDMMGTFICHGMTQDDCEAEALLMITAGSDTSAAIRSAVLRTITNPLIYQSFKAEIKAAVDGGNVSSPISYKQAQKLPYLRAIMYEGIRMRPPAPGIAPKTIGLSDETMHGKYLPLGTLLDAPARAKMEQNIEPVFGYGRWMCAGKPIAFMELHKILYAVGLTLLYTDFKQLFRHFDFQIVDVTKPWNSISYLGWMETEMWVKVTETT
ncbi:cytochrome P450 [Pseudomassariella vexata]|uniref:Cytochrome P450 n=1 Tax=Pseudomassariella vexata TaxID=1141098 RepID=A0A1Y2DEI1_9PEZI|nr:cytochrome P450 [Pseudomassariella vexata]ORY57504.1 cytochrome P450 [Pseudomassariella vexata]